MVRRLIAGATASMLIGMTCGIARADLTITFTQVGSNVSETATGRVDLTGLTRLSSNVIDHVYVDPAGPNTVVGALGPAVLYTGLTRTPAFGTGHATVATSGSGDIVGIYDNPGGSVGPLLDLPAGYLSGTAISGAATFANATISSLGLAPGTYTATWDGGGPDHTLTVQIGQPTAVPEPSTAILAGCGAVALLAHGWSRHRREQRRQAAA